MDPLFGVEGRQVVEQDLIPRNLRILEIDLFHLKEGEIPFALLRRTDLPGHDITGPEIEAADLRGRDINVIRAGQVIGIRRPKEPKAVRQGFQDSLSEDHTVLFGLSLEDGKDQLLLAQVGRSFDLEVPGHFVQISDGLLLQLCKMHGRLP